jgi:RNA 2',3'-cyclic 3'-phosphodiesterase
MPRLFTAIEIPAQMRTHLSFVRAPMAGAKWIEPDNMQITLRFIGDVDARTAGEFAEHLEGIQAEPFSLTIKGVGAFGGREPRVLWAGVEGNDALTKLHLAHERAARAVGLDPDPHDFRPHVTLARLRGAKSREVARFLEHNGALRVGQFDVSRFVLMSARPSTGGGPYAVEADYPFDRSADWADEWASDHP